MQKVLLDRSFGLNLKRIRKSCGMSQSDVARELQLLGRNISVTQYGHIEQGRANIFVADLVLLQRIFEVDYSEFFKDLVP